MTTSKGVNNKLVIKNTGNSHLIEPIIDDLYIDIVRPTTKPHIACCGVIKLPNNTTNPPGAKCGISNAGIEIVTNYDNECNVFRCSVDRKKVAGNTGDHCNKKPMGHDNSDTANVTGAFCAIFINETNSNNKGEVRNINHDSEQGCLNIKE